MGLNVLKTLAFNFVRKLVQHRGLIKTMVVRDCLNSEPVYGFEDQDLEDAQTLMEQKQIRRLLVMSRDEELVGIVALGDLASKVSAAMVGQATQAISSSK